MTSMRWPKKAWEELRVLSLNLKSGPIKLLATCFWLTDAQFARIRPYLPTERAASRRLIYGPRKTLYNRYVRWAAKGVWSNLFRPLASAGGAPEQVLIDSSAVKAHRSAAGGKGEQAQASAGPAASGRPKSGAL